MNCRWVNRKLVEFLEGELSGAPNSKIKAHLDSCPVCSRELDVLKKSWALLDKLPAIEPSPDFSSRFYKRLAQEQSRKPVTVFGSLRLSLRLAPALVTTVILLVFVNLYFNVRSYPIKKARLAVSGIRENKDAAEEEDIIENLELLEYLDMLEDLDVLEAGEGEGLSLEGA